MEEEGFEGIFISIYTHMYRQKREGNADRDSRGLAVGMI